jgi:flavin reductase (DIM6/NTAB) family NADH-FMN oxidoreductase RutF
MLIETAGISSRERYGLLTSLVVPRPIAWVSTRSRKGIRNLAPFSYFSALSSSPMLIGVSIGHRGDRPKDSLRNIVQTGAFCVNLVTEPMLERMNATSVDAPEEVDEFERAAVRAAEATTIDAPYVEECPAVLECVLEREIDLAPAPNTLVIGRVRAVRLADTLVPTPETGRVADEALRPVARLAGARYAFLGERHDLPRPPSEL